MNMPTSTIMLIDEIVDYMYNWDWISICCGHNWVFRGLTGHGVSCSLVSFLWNRNRSQWFPLASRSNNSLSPSPKSLSSRSSQNSFLFQKVPSSFLFLPFYMRESLEITLQSFGNDGSSVIITFCVFDSSFCELKSHLWQCLSGFW